MLQGADRVSWFGHPLRSPWPMTSDCQRGPLTRPRVCNRFLDLCWICLCVWSPSRNLWQHMFVHLKLGDTSKAMVFLPAEIDGVCLSWCIGLERYRLRGGVLLEVSACAGFAVAVFALDDPFENCPTAAHPNRWAEPSVRICLFLELTTNHGENCFLEAFLLSLHHLCLGTDSFFHHISLNASGTPTHTHPVSCWMTTSVAISWWQILTRHQPGKCQAHHTEEAALQSHAWCGPAAQTCLLSLRWVGHVPRRPLSRLQWRDVTRNWRTWDICKCRLLYPLVIKRGWKTPYKWRFECNKHL